MAGKGQCLLSADITEVINSLLMSSMQMDNRRSRLEGGFPFYDLRKHVRAADRLGDAVVPEAGKG